MASCPACHQIGFAGGRCSACGYEEPPVYELDLDIEDPVELSVDALTPLAPDSQRTTGGATPLPLDALEEVGPLELDNAEGYEPVPMVEGFEATMIEERARPRRTSESKPKRASTPFVHTVCPACQAPVAQPNPPFCEACGQRLATRRKKAEPETEASKLCGECGSKNAPDRGICRNCGARLKSLVE